VFLRSDNKIRSWIDIRNGLGWHGSQCLPQGRAHDQDWVKGQGHDAGKQFMAQCQGSKILEIEVRVLIGSRCIGK